MYWGITPLQVFVGCGYVTVTCLVSGDDDTFSVGQVAQPAILEAVELVTVIPSKPLSNQYIPATTEHFAVASLFCRVGHPRAEKVELAGVLEDAKVYHLLNDPGIQTDLAIMLILGVFSADEHALLLHADVADLDMAEFCWTYEGVIFHHASQVKPWVLWLDALLQLAKHGSSQGLALLARLGQLFNLGDRICRHVLLLYEELRQ